MKQAMKMFQPPRTTKSGELVVPKSPPLPTQLEGQRDIYDVLLDDLMEIAGES